MNTLFFNNITPKEHFFPDERNILQPGKYDDLIENKGGIDIAINAIGADAHTFGFNLPETPFSAKTRLVTINLANRQFIQQATGNETPELAITTGLATGMASKKIFFLVTGQKKSSALKKALWDPITEAVPASILRTHRDCTWIVDKEAASELTF